jgi:hypothetical protein
MTKQDDGGPAFPVPDLYLPNGQVQAGTYGMSLRDYFAGQIIGGMNSIKDERVWRPNSGETVDQWRRRLFATDAKQAYLQADAMLAARKETP